MPLNMNNSNISMQDLQDIGERLGLKYFQGYEYSRNKSNLVTFPITNLKLGEITNKEDSTGPIFLRRSTIRDILDIYGQFGPPVSKSIWRTHRKSSVQASQQELLVSTKTLGSMIFLIIIFVLYNQFTK